MGTDPQAPSGARPTTFRAACHEAMMGRDDYQAAGYHLAGLVLEAGPRDLPADDWRGRVEQLTEAIARGDRAAALAWFDGWLPRCMTLIPARHRDDFAEGVERAASDFTLGP